MGEASVIAECGPGRTVILVICLSRRQVCTTGGVHARPVYLAGAVIWRRFPRTIGARFRKLPGYELSGPCQEISAHPFR